MRAWARNNELNDFDRAFREVSRLSAEYDAIKRMRTRAHERVDVDDEFRRELMFVARALLQLTLVVILSLLLLHVLL